MQSASNIPGYPDLGGSNQSPQPSIDTQQARIKLERTFSEEQKQPSKDRSLVFKQQGNAHFQNKNFQAAIHCYDEAIRLNENNPQFFLNRAKCYKEVGGYKEMLKDALMAVELDDTYIKAFATLGEALVEVGKDDPISGAQIDKGIQRLRKAYSLCSSQNKRQHEEYIVNQIFKAQKIRYYKLREVQQQEKAGMMIDLKQKMKTYKDLMTVQFPAQVSTMEDPKETYKRFERYIQSSQDDKPVDVPDYFKCAISDEIMDEPVIIQSGHTYEKAMIMRHFQTSGPTDPITRQEVDPNVMIPNLMLKKAASDFIAKNPWAYQHIMNEDYHSIRM